MMSSFIKREVRELDENVFKMFADDRMLLTAGTEQKHNTMTVSWGSMGIIWGKPVAICFVRPQRYTNEFMKTNDKFTLSVLPETMRNALTICGSKSGRDFDKIQEAGLKPFVTPNGNIAFEHARIYFECQKIYSEKIHSSGIIDKAVVKEFYPGSDFHNMYFGEILGWYERPL